MGGFTLLLAELVRGMNYSASAFFSFKPVPSLSIYAFAEVYNRDYRKLEPKGAEIKKPQKQRLHGEPRR